MKKPINERREQVKATKHERIRKIIEKLNPPQGQPVMVLDEQLMLVLGVTKDKNGGRRK